MYVDTADIVRNPISLDYSEPTRTSAIYHSIKRLNLIVGAIKSLRDFPKILHENIPM